MVLRASFQLNTSISGSQLSGLPQGKGTTFPRQKQEKTAFCVVNRALKSYYIGTQREYEVRSRCEATRAIFFFKSVIRIIVRGYEAVRAFSFFLRLKNCQG